MKALVAVLVLALAGLAAWFFVSTPETAPPAEMSDAEIAQIEAEVEQIVRGLYSSVAQAEVGPWMATLHERTGPWLLGMDIGNLRETSEGFEALYTSEDETRPVRQEMDNLEIRVVAVSPTIAYAVGTSPDRRWYLANGGIDRAATAETWVFVQTEGGWKLYSGQTAIFPIEDEEEGQP